MKKVKLTLSKDEFNSPICEQVKKDDPVEFLIGWCHCPNCEYYFEYLTTRDRYVATILRSKRSSLAGKMAGLNDPMFMEVYAMIEKLVNPNKKLAWIVARCLFDHVFGDLCDSAPDGSKYDMADRLWCPKCHMEIIPWQHVSNIGFFSEDKLWDQEVHLVTHTEWDSFSAEQKAARLCRELIPIIRDRLRQWDLPDEADKKSHVFGKLVFYQKKKPGAPGDAWAALGEADRWHKALQLLEKTVKDHKHAFWGLFCLNEENK